MAFGGESNQNKDQKEVARTNGFSLYNLEGFDPSMLKVSFRETIMNLSISPALPNAKKGDQKQFDYESNVFTGLTYNLSAPALYAAITEELLPALKSNPASVKEVGIETASCYIGVGNGLSYTDEIRPYLVIRKIDDKRQFVGEICYEFKKSVYSNNYDSNNSSVTGSTEYYSEFMLFVNTLKNFIETIGGAAYHADRHNGFYQETRAKNEITAIAAALGVQSESGNKGSNGSGIAGRRAGGGTYFDRQNQNSQSFSAHESSASNMTELEAELEGASMLS